MCELKRTLFYDLHVAAGAKMVDFGGWDMPIQYPEGIIEEHLWTRHACSVFDVSHMGRFLIEGPDMVPFLQHVLTSNVDALDLNMSQYCIISNENGSAIDDAYLYKFEEERLLLVVNAGNIEKDKEHLLKEIEKFDCTLTDISNEWAGLAVQGPESKNILAKLCDINAIEPVKNALGTLELEGHTARLAKTGYTGEPLGYEVYMKNEDALWFWNRLMELGVKPAALGARDTLRMEAALPLYGHEMGLDKEGNELPIYAVALANFAVSFAPQKGDFIGKEALKKQFEARCRILNRDFSDMEALPRKIFPIALVDKAVLRADMDVYKNGKKIGWITSGTMVPYYVAEGRGLATKYLDETAKRSIGFAYLDSDTLYDEEVEVDVRGKMKKAVIPHFHMRADAPPFARPIIYEKEVEEEPVVRTDQKEKAFELITKAIDNHEWRQKRCINMIPSENSASKAVQMLLSSDPSFRYAEHKKIKSFYDDEIFYYQGTKFIDEVERMTVEQLKQYFGCTEVETRVTSGQMSNTCVFSAVMDWKNRLDRKHTPQRLGYVMNNHIIKGGHLSAQPMGALKDFIAIDPKTERHALVNFPGCPDNPYKTDVPATLELLAEYKPEFIIFGKSMVLHREPVAEVRQFVEENGIDTTIMYDMAHVLGLAGPYFQDPFKDGADIVTGSTHKTFFGPQRGIVATNWKKEDLKYGLWETIESRAFPGSVSNHHLGTQLGLCMAAYEMNAFKDEWQKAVVDNAKYFAKALVNAGFDVAGDPEIGYTETHQVIVNVGYGVGPEVAERLEENGIIVNYQATPDEEGFTASGGLRIGVNEMTRFGFTHEAWDKLAGLMYDCIYNKADVADEVAKLRGEFTEMKYCFNDNEMESLLQKFATTIGY